MINVLRALGYYLVRPRVEARGRHRIRRWLLVVWVVERNDWVGGRDLPVYRRVGHWRRVGWRWRRIEAALLAERLDKAANRRRVHAFRTAVQARPAVPDCPCICNGPEGCRCTTGRAWCGCRAPGCVTCENHQALTRPFTHDLARRKSLRFPLPDPGP